MFLLIILFLIGNCIGSFINALQYRIQIGKKNTGRSFCPKCKHQLAWYDLIPILSWILLLGKCRYCKKPISIQYPLIELSVGLIFVGVGLKSGFIQMANGYVLGINNFSFISFVSFLLLAAISTCLILTALHDAKTKYVLSPIVYTTAFLVFCWLVVNYLGSWTIAGLGNYLLSNISAMIFFGLIFFLIYFVSRGKWMGAGDIEIATMIGLFLGWPNSLVAFYFAFIIGAVFGLAKILAKKARMKSEIPFGPFLIAGTFFAFLFGEQMFPVYVRIFLGL
jgi:prepilin signal peptidase PulO-like enzyme (type II secretory pathway)